MTVKTNERATGKDVVDAVVENMLDNLEPLATQTLVPSVYHVYLHQSDYERLQTVFSQLALDAKRVLDTRLVELNEQKGPSDLLRRFLPGVREKAAAAAVPTVEERFVRVALEWDVQFQEDPNDDLGPGDVAVMSELSLPQAKSYGAGSLTRRVQTRKPAGGEASSSVSTSRSVHPEAVVEVGGPRGSLARLLYEDAGGRRTFRMVRPEIVIGRASTGSPTDLSLETSLDVSRQHVKIRHRMSDDSFWIRDLSSLGTTINGHALPPAKLPNGQLVEEDLSWVPLPDGADISLAGVLTLQFQAGDS